MSAISLTTPSISVLERFSFDFMDCIVVSKLRHYIYIFIPLLLSLSPRLSRLPSPVDQRENP